MPHPAKFKVCPLATARNFFKSLSPFVCPGPRMKSFHPNCVHGRGAPELSDATASASADSMGWIPQPSRPRPSHRQGTSRSCTMPSGLRRTTTDNGWFSLLAVTDCKAAADQLRCTNEPNCGICTQIPTRDVQFCVFDERHMCLRVSEDGGAYLDDMISRLEPCLV
jgi:hypothetical protein